MRSSLEGSRFREKLFETYSDERSRYNTLARCYGIEIRTVTITLHWVNRKVPIYRIQSHKQPASIRRTVGGSMTSALRELGIRKLNCEALYRACSVLVVRDLVVRKTMGQLLLRK